MSVFGQRQLYARPMTPAERAIWQTAFVFAWGTRFEEGEKAGLINITKIAIASASAAAAAVRVFRIAAEHMPPTDGARPFLDDMLSADEDPLGPPLTNEEARRMMEPKP